jgi:hypothetical protein
MLGLVPNGVGAVVVMATNLLNRNSKAIACFCFISDIVKARRPGLDSRVVESTE